MIRKSIIAFCVILFAGIHSEGKASEPIPLTLEEARSRALASNPSLLQAGLDVKAARWGMLGAVADALPHVSFNSSVTRFDDDYVYRQNIMRDVILQEYGQYINEEDFPPFAYKDMYASSISVDQPIYNGGIEFTAVRIARTRKQLIHLAREVQKRETVLQVEKAYYDLCRAYQAAEIQKHALDVTRGYLDRSRRRQQLGLISEVDVLRWEVQESDDFALLIEAQNALSLSQSALAQVMGSSLDESYYPADLRTFSVQDSADLMEGVSSAEVLWEKMQQSSPDLQISDDNVKLEKHNVWLAAANFQPKLNFNYTYSWQADDDVALDGFESWTANISLSMPLFSSFGNVARWQESRLNVRRAQEGARDYRTSLYLQLTTAYNDLSAASSRHESARKMKDRSRKVLATQEKQYELGLITTLELMDARTADLRADINLMNAYFDGRVAKATLMRIAGDISQIE